MKKGDIVVILNKMNLSCKTTHLIKISTIKYRPYLHYKRDGLDKTGLTVLLGNVVFLALTTW